VGHYLSEMTCKKCGEYFCTCKPEKRKFIRENRYLVLKNTDIEKHCNQEDKKWLASISTKISEGRYLEEKEELKCVVVESDWPEHEEVWSMIESRGENK